MTADCEPTQALGRQAISGVHVSQAVEDEQHFLLDCPACAPLEV